MNATDQAKTRITKGPAQTVPTEGYSLFPAFVPMPDRGAYALVYYANDPQGELYKDLGYIGKLFDSTEGDFSEFEAKAVSILDQRLALLKQGKSWLDVPGLGPQAPAAPAP